MEKRYIGNDPEKGLANGFDVYAELGYFDCLEYEFDIVGFDATYVWSYQ